jgi:tetratricopeptide (TPR) repeat protein
VADFSKAIETAPPDDGAVPWAYFGRANAYRALKQLDKTLADLTRATELWPKLYEVWAWRGWFYRDQKQWDKSAADFTRALELNPTFWRVWFDRAVVQIQLKKPEMAVADLREAVRHGLLNAEERLKTDRAFETLRSREDFKSLLAELRQKAK